jgi:hypothetical protein
MRMRYSRDAVTTLMYLSAASKYNTPATGTMWMVAPRLACSARNRGAADSPAALPASPRPRTWSNCAAHPIPWPARRDEVRPDGVKCGTNPSPADVTDSLHRIDPATVRREVEAVGFVFDSESKILANPADPRSTGVFDKSIRGHTDQFLYKFLEPKR